MIELQVDELSVEMWASPGSNFPSGRRDDLWELARDGFAQIVDVIDDGRCRGAFMVDPIDLGSERVLYLSLAAVHSSLRGRCLYLPMVLLRLALGRLWDCTWGPPARPAATLHRPADAASVRRGRRSSPSRSPTLAPRAVSAPAA